MYMYMYIYITEAMPATKRVVAEYRPGGHCLDAPPMVEGRVGPRVLGRNG